jgi:hypothetical protein
MNSLLFVFLLWIIWYNFATLPLTTIFKPITSLVINWIHKNYTLPLTNYYATGEGSNPMLLPTIVGITFIVVITTWRILYQQYFPTPPNTKRRLTFFNAGFTGVIFAVINIIGNKPYLVSKRQSDWYSGNHLNKRRIDMKNIKLTGMPKINRRSKMPDFCTIRAGTP